ncbi:glycosyltransferase family 39 protein [Mucilaginibacter pallidiroseus]|uniref:Glycosyltransferase family 39 protein n=1 Tax=Mucilaginibacter pallidiroseus TaxID=2599295 RepID=A0A563U7Q6_9SPHI|nr:glycosyltransferase family 39 protein [Mucilaginibacter pallidiroseus]TWR27401.1 glycosyltransferase family 39 protein [Mucilaginibacter pallidiroseus]
MQDTTASHINQSNKPIWYFILCWTIFNALQAYTLELHADEAYYWLFAQKLDWGYFYHPPMVALFIKIGDTLLHNELGLRLLTVLSNSAAIWLLWLVVKPYQVSSKWFILLVSGILVFHVYGFTSTPDAPLFFFAVLFYYFYQRYLQHDKWQTAIIIGIITACLLYSKYHGVLLIGFTILSNLKLFNRKTFYLALVTGVALYVPHILWQAHRGFPAVNYQLFERSVGGGYDLEFSLVYLAGQLALGGVLISWYLFYKGFTAKITDAFARALLVNAIGIFGFFLLNTLKVNVQPHYTLIAFIPLVCLVLIGLARKDAAPGWLGKLAIINVIVVVFIRLALMSGLPFLRKVEALKSYFGFHEWANLVHAKAGNAFVVMDEGFQNPSKYSYYTRSLKGFAYDSRGYGRTMFDIWPMEDSLQHQRIYFLSKIKQQGLSTDSIVCRAGKWYGGWVDDTRTYQKIAIDANTKEVKAHPGQIIHFDLSITNPYPYDVNFTNSGYKHAVYLEACFFKKRDIVYISPVEGGFNEIKLEPGKVLTEKLSVKAPEQKGEYHVLFSIRTDPFSGAKNSPFVKVIVD